MSAWLSGARLDGQRALPHGRQTHLAVQHLVRARPEQPEAAQPSRGQHDGVELAAVQLAEARLHVAAQGGVVQVRTLHAQLRDAAQGRGPHTSRRRQRHEVDAIAREQHVARVFTLGEAHQRHALGQLHVARDVFQRVHREVGLTAGHAGFHLGHEQPLATDGGQRTVGDAVAQRGDVHLLDLDLGVERHDARGERPHLREREVAAAGRHAELHAPWVFRVGSGGVAGRSTDVPRGASWAFLGSAASTAASAAGPEPS
jgi:hypothetical protein